MVPKSTLRKDVMLRNRKESLKNVTCKIVNKVNILQSKHSNRLKPKSLKPNNMSQIHIFSQVIYNHRGRYRKEKSTKIKMLDHLRMVSFTRKNFMLTNRNSLTDNISINLARVMCLKRLCKI